MKKTIYADNASTTQLSKSVEEAILHSLRHYYGNPSSIHELGVKSKAMIDAAKCSIANVLKAKKEEIYFTSGGTESNNWAIKGVLEESVKNGKNHIITTTIEHSSVLNACRYLEKRGMNVTYLPVSEKGYITAQQVFDAITPYTALVSIVFANNEIGTIQPIKEIGEVCKKYEIPFHTDAVQAVGNIDIDVNDLNIDLLSMSGHKIHALKGIGALYIRNGTKISNLMHGGKQERSKRPGTENVIGIVSIGQACDDILTNLLMKIEYSKVLRDALIYQILSKIPKSKLNGDSENRLCGNTNFSFQGIEGESIVLMMDKRGICLSSGSACASGSLEPSHVLKAIGLDDELASGSVRITINENNTMEDINDIVTNLEEVVSTLRMMSPTWLGE